MSNLGSRYIRQSQVSRRDGLLQIGLLSALCFVGQITHANAQNAPAPKEPVEVRIALSAGLDRLDPAKTANGPDLAIMSQIYETLLELDPKSGNLSPKLATSYAVKSPTVWQFKLRKDVKFQDGSPFTAADVKYSIDRLLDPTSAHYSQVVSIAKV